MVFLIIFIFIECEYYLYFFCIYWIKIFIVGGGKSFCGLICNICLLKLLDIKFKMLLFYWGCICGSDKKNFVFCKFELEFVENENINCIFYIWLIKYLDYYVYMYKEGNCFFFKG